MADIQLPLSPHQATVEANRCLYCFDAPCIAACPTGIDVPEFIRAIASQSPRRAARTIYQANILGGTCARVCPTQVLCEGACVLHDRDEKPIEIGRLQRFATDWVEERGICALPQRSPATGKCVAIIGSGPAGLSCAAQLAQLGHRVTIYERAAIPGGLSSHGIALYKIDQAQALKEVEMVRSMGVEIRCGVEVGGDISGEELLKQYDCVFLAIGLGCGQRMGVPGEELAGVVDALSFISRIHNEPLDSIEIGKTVLVIGGGNTAIDAATQSKRLGAQRVAMIYRRGLEQMSAYQFEQELARVDGVEILTNSVVTEFHGKDGRIRAVTMVGPDACSTRLVECDMVLKAIGQSTMHEQLNRMFPSLALDARGRVKCDDATGATSMAKVFSGGDCCNGGREVVNAVGEGKKAALAMHRFITGDDCALPLQPSRAGSACPRGSGIVAPIRSHELEREWERIHGGEGSTNG